MFKVYQAGKYYLVMSSYDNDLKRSIDRFSDVGDCKVIKEFGSIDPAVEYCNNRLKNDPTLIFYIEGPDKIIEETIMDEKVQARIIRKKDCSFAWKFALIVSAVIGIAYYLMATYSQVTYIEAFVGWSIINIIYALTMLCSAPGLIIEYTVPIVIIAIIGGIFCPEFKSFQLKQEATHQTGENAQERTHDKSR
ncbi:MAG: hypothetical protein V3V59_02180 [Thermodesulfovibrionales bacterium]